MSELAVRARCQSCLAVRASCEICQCLIIRALIKQGKLGYIHRYASQTIINIITYYWTMEKEILVISVLRTKVKCTGYWCCLLQHQYVIILVKWRGESERERISFFSWSSIRYSQCYTELLRKYILDSRYQVIYVWFLFKGNRNIHILIFIKSHQIILIICPSTKQIY